VNSCLCSRLLASRVVGTARSVGTALFAVGLAASLGNLHVAAQNAGILERQQDSEFRAAALERVSQAVEYLASDELEGRGVNTAGLDTAGNYLVNEFKEIGLQPMPGGSYKQPFEIPMGLLNEDTANLTLNFGDESFELKLDEDYAPQMTGDKSSGEGDVVFVGYGINSDEHNYNEYRDVDVDGKFVVIIRNEPQADDQDSVFNGDSASPHARISTKAQAARDAGAIGVLFVNDRHNAEEDGYELDDNRRRFNVGRQPLPFVHVTREWVNRMLAESPLTVADGSQLKELDAVEAYIDANLEPISGPLNGWSVAYSAEPETGNIFNVVGVLEGTGPHADEVIVIGGHYDHLGYGGYGSMAPDRVNEIHNGADDNATGTVAVVELARRFASNSQKPGRTMVFVCFSGEERGLHGSQFYVDNPPFPLEKTVAMINFDMIGYLRDENLSLLCGQSGDVFEEICNEAGSGMELNLNVGASAAPNSDHWPFYSKKIPAMFVHTGITRVLHTPDDKYELLNMEGALRCIDFTERVLDQLQSLDEAPNFVELGRRARRLQSSMGAQIDFTAEAGPTVLQVTEGKAAEQAGLQKGDVLVYLDDAKVSRTSVMQMLRKEPGTKVEVKLKRDGEMKTVEMELSDR